MLRPSPAESTIAGMVSGEFDRIPEANDAFLELVGYSREDLQAGRLHWPDLTPSGVSRAWTRWRTKKACGSGPVRRSKKS